MNYSNNNGYGFNLNSLVTAVVLVWFGECFLVQNQCWSEHFTNAANKKMLIFLSGIRLVLFSLIVCIVKFSLSHAQVNRMLHLGHRLGNRNAEIESFRYRRRNYVIIGLFLAWMLTKVFHLRDREDTQQHDGTYFFERSCSFFNSWPFILFSLQFLVWMQIFSRALKISTNKLRRAIINSQQPTPNERRSQVIESIVRVKFVLELKEKILHVYGFSVVVGQLRASVWIILNAYWYPYRHNSWRTLLDSIFMLNFPIAFLPHWFGQEISSEVSSSQTYVLRGCDFSKGKGCRMTQKSLRLCFIFLSLQLQK